ncbi:hypothetical protein BDA96_08G136700 [Sorghum bicolor]|uniref:Uncharacterized protein n=1 Tax=Sorghum bicolor TaxID=4558 RepID=A0A921QII7_SORBI|nr:hypothetical protein BDA96_08G136700 [Sorghum bicolor]
MARQKSTMSASAMASLLLILLLLLPVALPVVTAVRPMREDLHDRQPQAQQLVGIYPPLKGHLPPREDDPVHTSFSDPRSV